MGDGDGDGDGGAVRGGDKRSSSAGAGAENELEERDKKRARPRSMKKCMAPNCESFARSRGLCKAHGGGKRCKRPGCTLSDQGGGFCIRHGGGKRCQVEGCLKSAQSRRFCKAHGGGARCKVEGCHKSSQGGGCCRTHGGGPKRKRSGGNKTSVAVEELRATTLLAASLAVAFPCGKLPETVATGNRRYGDALIKLEPEAWSSAPPDTPSPQWIASPELSCLRSTTPSSRDTSASAKLQPTSPVMKIEKLVLSASIIDAIISSNEARSKLPKPHPISEPEPMDCSPTSQDETEFVATNAIKMSKADDNDNTSSWCRVGGCRKQATTCERDLCDEHKTNLALAASLLDMQAGKL